MKDVGLGSVCFRPAGVLNPNVVRLIKALRILLYSVMLKSSHSGDCFFIEHRLRLLVTFFLPRESDLRN